MGRAWKTARVAQIEGMHSRMSREFRSVGVVGLGTMGAGIVEVFARSGLAVYGLEPNEEALARGRGHLESSTGRALKRGKLSQDERQAILGRVTFTSEVQDLADTDLVIEAVPEHLDLKQEIFSTLDKVCKPETILATNTSSLSVTQISTATTRPSSVVGMHFFNPAPVLRLVEVVRTVVTDPHTVEDVATLARQLGKVPVVIGDQAGFIANALLFGYLNNAMSMYESRFASREDIDVAMTRGAGLPMGPFALLDLIGLDTSYEVLESMYGQSRDRVHAPAPILKQMVTAGLRGRKSGRGFYTYEAPGSPVVVPDALTPAPDGDGAARSLRSVGVVARPRRGLGARLAAAFARAGYDVVAVPAGGQDSAGLSRAVEAVAAEGSEVAVRVVDSVDDLAGCDLVVDAGPDEPEVKRATFTALGAGCRPGTILATAGALVPVIECAAAAGRPADVVGLHPVGPAGGVGTIGAVEVVNTVATTPEVVAAVVAAAARLEVPAVRCGDRAGFILDALLFPYLNDAVRMLQAQYASADDIDTAMKVGCGYALGPFEQLDAIGLDVALAVQRRLFEEFREPSWAPAPLLEHLVTAGFLGRKSGRGFRDYS